MKEFNEAEVEVNVAIEDRLDMATTDEVQMSSTVVTRKEKAQQQNTGQTIQAQGMINLKPDATTIKRLATMLQNVDFPIIELRRRLTMWSLKMRSLKQCS